MHGGTEEREPEGQAAADDLMRTEQLSAELHEVVASVRRLDDLQALDLPMIDQCREGLGLTRSELLARAIEHVEESDYRKFLELLLPFPFDGTPSWPALGRKYISEADAGRGVRAGYEVFGVTTWDALNAPLGELGGLSRREHAEALLAGAVIDLCGAGSPRRARRARLSAVGIASTVGLVMAMVLVVSAGGGDAEDAAGADDVVGDGDAATENAVVPEATVESQTTVTLEELPESELAGIQPGVEAAPDLEEVSSKIELALSEEHLIFRAFGDIDVEPSPVYELGFLEMPGRFHYQAFNPLGDNIRCRGMMTRELEVVGLWERGAKWPGGWLQVSVGRLAEPWMAHEMATALSLTTGVVPQRCRGMARFGVEDYDDYGVAHRDELELLAPGDDYNHWSQPDSIVAGRVWPNSNRIILERGPYVVDLAVLSDAQQPLGDAVALGSVAKEIVFRL